MKTKSLELLLHQWPYGLELQMSPEGLLLRPRRKARVDWARAFRRPSRPADDLAATRQLTNEFDRKEWEWCARQAEAELSISTTRPTSSNRTPSPSVV